jgi:membrane protease YdiL (CAAX protease family)
MNFLNSLNPIFEMARSGKRIMHVIIACVLSIAFVFGGQLLGYLLFEVLYSAVMGKPLLPEDDLNYYADTPLLQGALFAASLILSFGLIFVLVALWMRFVEKRPFWTVGLPWQNALWRYARGLLFGLGMFALTVGICAAWGYMEFENGPLARQGLAALGGVLVVFLGWVVQGAGEEVVTRGWLMQSVGARYKPWLGVLLSSIVFVILHGLNPNLSVLALVNLFLFATFAALYTLREGALWGICAWHSVWNWAQGNFFGLEVSGTNAPGGMLLNLREVGPDLVTGGPFGPEGGLAATFVLALCIVLTAVSNSVQRKRLVHHQPPSG